MEPKDEDRRAPPGLDHDVQGALDARLAPARPDDAALLARVRERVLAAIAGESQAHRTLRAGEGAWVRIAEGVERKVLHEDGSAVSSLVRLAPGATVPGHAHPIDEECLVLEGTFRIGPALLLKAGDFHLGRRGLPHDAAGTDTGALLYVRAARVAA